MTDHYDFNGSIHSKEYYHPVGYTLAESSGDLRYRIQTIHALDHPNFTIKGSDVDRQINTKAFHNRLRKIYFHSCPTGQHLIQSYKKKTLLHAAVRIIGYQVVTNSQVLSPVTGLTQARETLAEHNNDEHLLGITVNNEDLDIINHTTLYDPSAPWNQPDFDTGVCNCTINTYDPFSLTKVS